MTKAAKPLRNIFIMYDFLTWDQLRFTLEILEEWLKFVFTFFMLFSSRI